MNLSKNVLIHYYFKYKNLKYYIKNNKKMNNYNNNIHLSNSIVSYNVKSNHNSSKFSDFLSLKASVAALKASHNSFSSF